MNSFVPLIGAFAMVMATGPLATISLKGAVNKPGELEVTKTTNVRSLIQDNGGLRKDADSKKIEVRSKDGSIRRIDLTRFDNNETLKAGDSVTVPVINEKDYVFVNGAVQAKGPVDYKAGMDIVSVVNQAGVPHAALKSEVRLTRGGATTMVDLNKIEAGLQANISLLPADRVEVPYVQEGPSNRQLLIGIGILVVLIFLFR